MDLEECVQHLVDRVMSLKRGARLMRLVRFIRYLFLSFFNRTTIILIYWLITLFACIQAMIRSSLLVGGGQN